MHRHYLRRRALLTALGLTAVVAGAVVTASPAAQRATPQLIGDAHVGTDAAGDTVAAWTRGNSIEAAVRPASASAWGVSQVLVTFSFPVGYWSLAVGKDGLALVVYERRIGAASTIWARTLQLPGSAWSPAVRVSGPAGVGVRAVVQAAVAGDGRAVAIWRERPAGRFVLVGATHAAGAARWTAPVQATGSACAGAFIPELSATGSGPSVAAWVCFERTGARRLRTVQLSAAGTFGRVFTLAQ